MPVTFVGVVAVLDVLTRRERRRRLTVERLLQELMAIGVDRVVLESRGPADRLDRQHVDALRSRRLLTDVRVDHVPGTAEPLLWAADAMCGVIAADRQDNGQHRLAVGVRLVVHEEPR